MSFTFVDLFAGIGGFHAAMTAAGGECVYAVEIDEAAALVYKRNWGIDPLGDITSDVTDIQVKVPPHDVLCAGFPCQPFSKSGAQRGMDETRGTLYWNILRIIQEHRPSVVLLENVRNLHSPRHFHEWQLIIETIRAEGYRVSETPSVFSPHLLAPDAGGRPQVRERIFITATLLPEGRGLTADAEPVTRSQPVGGWNPQFWDLASDLLLDEFDDSEICALTDQEHNWIEAWDDFVVTLLKVRGGRRLPGFPLWADEWHELDPSRQESEPKWKADFLKKNSEFYFGHQRSIDRWTKTWGIYSESFPPSRRKLEWQAQDMRSLWDTVMHFRPSGVRAKAPTYLPALVAITQTSIIGPRRRRIAPKEAARLQGLPQWFDFGGQSTAQTFRQLGNGVSVGAVWHVFKEHAARDEEILKYTNPRMLRVIQQLPLSPDPALESLRPSTV